MALRALIIFLVATVVNCSDCDRIYTAESGVIRSPGSSSYPNNANCTYIIKGDHRFHTLEFTFDSFDLESCCDYLHMGEKRYSGVELKGKQINHTFSNSYTLRFTTDGSVTLSGFVIKYKLITECRAGYYGQRCSSECSSGCSDVCNTKTGRCACKPGKTGANCDADCPSGTYEAYCISACSPGCVDGSCDKKDGSCSCKAGYKSTRCDQVCASNRYGPGCTKVCSDGCNSFACDGATGFCKCKPGWTGEKCDKDCTQGLYGLNCSQSCSPGCSDICNRRNGLCNCRAGWEGEKCETECPHGKYGVNCESDCSPGCGNGSCNSTSGICPCIAGLMGEKCLQECVNGTYGVYCKHKCSNGCANDTCNSTNGTCSCVSGYLGDRCSFNLILITSVSVGVLVAMLIPVSVFALISRRKRRRKEKKQESILKKTTKISDALSMKNIASQGNEYVDYDEDALYVDPKNIDEGQYEDVTYSGGQTSVSETAPNTDYANKDALYGNVQFSGNEPEDIEEEIDYQNVSAVISKIKNRSKNPR